MKRLPNARWAVVDERKITAYLPSSDHPVGQAKAALFRRYGFRASSWRALRDALLAHAQSGEIVHAVDTEFGTKYIVDGALAALDGRTPRLRTVWFVEAGDVFPRLVTAYPPPGGDA